MSGSIETLDRIGGYGESRTDANRAGAWQAAEAEAAADDKPTAHAAAPASQPDGSLLDKSGHALTNPHVILGAAAFAPSVFGAAASALDGVIYAAQGDKTDAAISLGAAALGVVSDAGAAKLAGEGLKMGAEALADGGKIAHAADGAKTAGELAHGADTAEAATHAAKLADPISEALARGEKLSAGKPPVELDHVFEGEVSPKKGKLEAKGFHHDPGDSLNSNASVISVTKPRDVHGVYEANVKVTDTKTGASYTKPSTMFPDSMSRSDVVQALQHAYDNASVKAGNSFTGPSGFGFDVKGYTSGSGAGLQIRTGYPLYTK